MEDCLQNYAKKAKQKYRISTDVNRIALIHIGQKYDGKNLHITLKHSPHEPKDMIQVTDAITEQKEKIKIGNKTYSIGSQGDPNGPLPPGTIEIKNIFYQ